MQGCFGVMEEKSGIFYQGFSSPSLRLGAEYRAFNKENAKSDQFLAVLKSCCARESCVHTNHLTRDYRAYDKGPSLSVLERPKNSIVASVSKF